MTLAAPPPGSPTRAATLDARMKLIGWFALAVAVAAARTPPALVVALTVAAALTAITGVSRGWLAGRLALLAVPAVPFFLFAPLTAWVPDADGTLRLDWTGGLATALLVCGKLIALGWLGLLFYGVTPWPEAVRAARALGVPRSLAAVAFLAERFTWVIADELRRLRLAARVRGFRNRAGWHAYRTVGSAAGVLVLRGSDRADRVAQVLRCRGFTGDFAGPPFRACRADWIVLAMLLATAVSVTAVDVWWGPAWGS